MFPNRLLLLWVPSLCSHILPPSTGAGAIPDDSSVEENCGSHGDQGHAGTGRGVALDISRAVVPSRACFLEEQWAPGDLKRGTLSTP